MKKIAVLSIAILLFASCSNRGSNKDNQSTLSNNEMTEERKSFESFLTLFNTQKPIPDSISEKYLGKFRSLIPKKILVKNSLVVCRLVEDMDRFDIMFLYTKDGRLIDYEQIYHEGWSIDFSVREIKDSLYIVANSISGGEGLPLKYNFNSYVVASTGINYSNEPKITAQEFIDNFTQIRKNCYSSIEGYKISAEVIFSNSDFSIISFNEEIQNYSYAYCIAINPNEKYTGIQNAQAVYDEIATSLQNIKANLYIGHLIQTLDITNDGSPDFLLSSENSYRTTMNKESRLLLFDGKSELKTTDFVAKSDFEAGVCDFFTGVREELLIDEITHFITIHREENISPSGGCDEKELIQLNYDKVWIVDQGNFDSIAKLNTPNLETINAFKELLKKFTLIEEQDGKYIIPENCQKGGANTFEFSKYSTSKNTNVYIVKESSDNAELFFIAGYKQIDQGATEIYLRPNNSKEHGDDFDAIELNGEFRIVKITHDVDNIDRYWITFPNDGKPKLATIQAEKYTFVKMR